MKIKTTFLTTTKMGLIIFGLAANTYAIDTTHNLESFNGVPFGISKNTFLQQYNPTIKEWIEEKENNFECLSKAKLVDSINLDSTETSIKTKLLFCFKNDKLVAMNFKIKNRNDYDTLKDNIEEKYGTILDFKDKSGGVIHFKQLENQDSIKELIVFNDNIKMVNLMVEEK